MKRELHWLKIILAMIVLFWIGFMLTRIVRAQSNRRELPINGSMTQRAPYLQYCNLEQGLDCGMRGAAVTFTRASAALCPTSLDYTNPATTTTQWVSLANNAACHLAGSGLHVAGKIYNYGAGDCGVAQTYPGRCTTGDTASMAAASYTYHQTDSLGTANVVISQASGAGTVTVNGNAVPAAVNGNSPATGAAVVIAGGTAVLTLTYGTAPAEWSQLSDRKFVPHRVDNANWPGGSTFAAVEMASLPAPPETFNVVAGGIMLTATTDWDRANAAVGTPRLYTSFDTGAGAQRFTAYLFPASNQFVNLLYATPNSNSVIYTNAGLPICATPFSFDFWWNPGRIHVRVNGLGDSGSDVARVLYPTGLTQLYLGNLLDGVAPLDGWIKNFYTCPGPIGCREQVAKWGNP